MSSTAQALAPGTLVLGRYRPLRPLGAGGSGSVWLARDVAAGRDVALKVVPRQGNAAYRARREAKAASRLRHHGCLRAHALARDRGHVYIAYEYVPGRTLREALRSGDLDAAAALEVAAQILEVLAHAHAEGIVHRDVKPANVLLCDGPQLQVKLFDFGLAQIGDEETLTAAGDVPGTLAYMSPERLGGRPAGPEADVWAVGVILWEALAGRHPFWSGTLLDTARHIERGAPSLAEARPDLPAAVIDCVDRALAVDPARRPQARSLARQLRRAAADGGRRPSRSRLRPVAPFRPLAAHLAHAGAAGLFVGWTTAAFPFFPAGWPAALATVAAGLALLGERAALALALAVPILPLGNHALGLALLYAALAGTWLVAFWRAPRWGLMVVLGPLLAPVAAVGLLPAALVAVPNPLRRALLAAGAVLAAAAVSASGRLAELGLSSSERPAEAASALAVVLSARPDLLLEAAALAAAAAVLPLVRGRGPGAIALYGAAVLAPFLAAARLPSLSLAAYIGATCAFLVIEPRLRRRPRDDAHARTAAVLVPLPPARRVAGRG